MYHGGIWAVKPLSFQFESSLEWAAEKTRALQNLARARWGLNFAKRLCCVRISAALDVFAQRLHLRRGWCLGSDDFKTEMLEKMETRLGEHHSGELKRQTAEAKAKRIIAEDCGFPPDWMR